MNLNKALAVAIITASTAGALVMIAKIDTLMLGSAKHINHDAMKADNERVREIINDSTKSGLERNEYREMQAEYWGIVSHILSKD